MSTLPMRPSPRQTSTRYAVAIFLSSSMLFLLEPIAGKRLVPLLGGSAAVWTACLVFFQSALLLGYLAAHWLVTQTRVRLQIAAYIALLAFSLAQLAVTIDPRLHASSAHPIASVLWLLTALIGLPFVTLSATSPLLQAWYAMSSHHTNLAEDPTSGISAQRITHPYRLYAISNIGSLLALLMYPWLVEPRLSLHDQMIALLIGFAVLTALCALIALSMRHAVPQPTVIGIEREAAPNSAAADDPTSKTRVLWVALAACGSLLLSAMTNHISQNVATIPLLWIAPLVAYLLSFVFAFGGERCRPRWLMFGLALVGLASAGYLLYKGILHTPILRAAGIFCGSLFLLCLFLHSELYRRRPSSRQLTTFYFYVAAGGALGAMLVGIVAPTLLPGNYEFAFGLCLAAALGLTATWKTGWFARIVWATATVLTANIIVTQVKADRVNSLHRVRNFYGTLHVTQVNSDIRHAFMRTLYNGVISHGQQVLRADLRRAPTTYYGRSSGVGVAIDRCCGDRPRRVGVIGLGAGTIAAYGRAGDTFRFYDINPDVEGIARRYFTYLRDSPAHVEVVTGDARVSLAGEAPQRYDVIAVDAFSGDAVPVHLIDAQALDLYRRHLTPRGIVAFHVSNRYLDLKAVVAQLAAHAGLRAGLISTEDDYDRDVWGSDWVLVTADTTFLEQPTVAKARTAVAIPAGLRLWTDDYNSLLPIWRR